MCCGEPDWPHCQAMIAKQRNVMVKHRVVANLPEIDAHNAVYEAFNNADPSWIRAKIDADVVLFDETIFEQIANDLAIRKFASGLNPFVHDYMTDTEIKAGVTFYTSSAKFKQQLNPLRCDRNVLEDESTVRDWRSVGRHMHHANEATAFRYGLHRGLKGQTTIKALVEKAYMLYRDPIRLMALKGFDVGLNDPRFQTWHQNGTNVPAQHGYVDAEFWRLFESVKNNV